VSPGDVAPAARLVSELAEQGLCERVPRDQLPARVEDRNGQVGQPVEHALHAGREVA
jgi:hypothetical protein